MKGYGQFCPVAKAAEVIGERWTPLVIRELVAGSEHFNDIRRGIPLISPSLLSRRLRSLEVAGVVERFADAGGVRYRLTEAGRELEAVIELLGRWGNRWVRSQLEESELDAGLLMWDIRRNVVPARIPRSKSVIQFEFTDTPRRWRYFWLVVYGGESDLCLKNPGLDVDLLIRTPLALLAGYWIGSTSWSQLVRSPDVRLLGDSRLKDTLKDWLGRSVFANTP